MIRPQLPRVLFIAGWGRSGSTLLDRMAGETPGVVSVGEIRELWHRGCLEDRLCGCGNRFSECEFWTAVGKESFGGWQSFDAHRAAALRDRLDRVWMVPALTSRRFAGKEVLADQAEYHELLRRLYRGILTVSGANVIVDSSKLATHGMLLHGAGVPTTALHLVRDSRGVIYSWQKRVERPDGTGDLMIRYGTAAGSTRYLFYNALAQGLQVLGMDYQRVRYEDLVSDPASVLPAVLRHAGIDDSTPYAVGEALPLGTHHTVDGNPMRFSVGPVRLKVDDAWRRAMPPGKRAVVAAITAPLLVAYGYTGRRRRRPVAQAGERRALAARAALRSRRVIRTVAVGSLRTTSRVRPAPDFLIVGAQRCGTTSLFRALSAHPGILTPVLGTKGVHYFDTSYGRPLDWYLAHFPTTLARRVASLRAGVPAVAGEASPYYVFHPAAPARIAEALPDAQLILLLRDPVSRAHSHYHHMLFEGHETAGSFEEAIDLEPARLEGEEERLLADPLYVSEHHQHHSYLARGNYAHQLQRLHTLFPPEQTLVLDSSRFFADPRDGLARIQEFLGLRVHPAVVLKALNGGDYPDLLPQTLRRLREHFEASDRELSRLLGWAPSWCS